MGYGQRRRLSNTGVVECGQRRRLSNTGVVECGVVVLATHLWWGVASRRRSKRDPIFIYVFPFFQAALASVIRYVFIFGITAPVRVQSQCGVNCFILDSRRVLAPARKVLGSISKHTPNPNFGRLKKKGSDAKI